MCFDYFLLEGRRFKGEVVVAVVRGARGGDGVLTSLTGDLQTSAKKRR